MNIDEMQAGAEMDRLVVEEVLGRPYEKPGHGICCTCQVCGQCHDDCLCGISDCLEWAWTLVPHLPYFSLYRRTSPGYPELWQCQSRFCGNGLDHSSANCSCVAANAETAALAICRAAVML